jgi:4-hydroxy-tetrahydrodipicolinate synthase
MVTPFNEAGEINESEVRRIARWLVRDQSNDGIVVAGTTGESPTLSPEEKLRLLEIVLDEVGSEAAIVFGAGTYDTRESVHLTHEASQRGAHGIMAVNPYYNRPGQEGLEAHFREIAGATQLPVMLYNIQPRSAINLETETLLRLAEVENIVAVKEASGNLNQITDICSQLPHGFRVYSGDDGLILPTLSVGGVGLVSVAAHCIGKDLKAVISKYAAEPLKARQSFHRVLPFIRAIFAQPSPVPIKYCLSRLGFDCRSVRLPLVELRRNSQHDLDSVMVRCGLLDAAQAGLVEWRG